MGCYESRERKEIRKEKFVTKEDGEERRIEGKKNTRVDKIKKEVLVSNKGGS